MCNPQILAKYGVSYYYNHIVNVWIVMIIDVIVLMDG